MLVEVGVDGGRINVHVGMRFLDALDAFGSAHEIEAEDALAAGASWRRSIVAMSEPPVASMGSRIMAMRWSISLASFT